jgi:hypothetical protein
MPLAFKLISADEQLDHDPAPPPETRYARRLSDKILLAFHHACDQTDFEVADDLLDVLEFMANGRTSNLGGTVAPRKG